MPTYNEMYALIDETDQEWVTNYNSSGVNGLKIMNKSDHSKYIFLPAAGNFTGQLGYNTMFGFYWSSTITGASVHHAAEFYFGSGTSFRPDRSSRTIGFSIRPVRNL